MLTKRIVPCLDIKDGRIVKGVNFINLRDAGDPVEQATVYDRMGADELVMLDISATPRGRKTTLETVQLIAKQIFLPLTVGGGIRCADDIQAALLAGADKIGINSAAVRTPDILRAGSERFGAQCIVLAVDAKRTAPGKWEVYIDGARTPTGLDAIEWVQRATALGAGEILLTSIDADGTRAGYDIELTQQVSEAVPVPVIASGGAGSVQHFEEVFRAGKADAALAASLFHDNELSIPDLKDFLIKQGIHMRPPTPTDQLAESTGGF